MKKILKPIGDSETQEHHEGTQLVSLDAETLKNRPQTSFLQYWTISPWPLWKPTFKSKTRRLNLEIRWNGLSLMNAFRIVSYSSACVIPSNCHTHKKKKPTTWAIPSEVAQSWQNWTTTEEERCESKQKPSRTCFRTCFRTCLNQTNLWNIRKKNPFFWPNKAAWTYQDLLKKS